MAGNAQWGLPTIEEAADAASILLRCNGWDLDVWSDGNWPTDADEFLKPMASRNSGEVNESGTKAQREAFMDALDMVEQRFPGSFWHIAKGRVKANEPLYAIQILFGTEEVLAEGEGDTAAEAIHAALAGVP